MSQYVALALDVVGDPIRKLGGENRLGLMWRYLFQICFRAASLAISSMVVYFLFDGASLIDYSPCAIPSTLIPC